MTCAETGTCCEITLKVVYKHELSASLMIPAACCLSAASQDTQPVVISIAKGSHKLWFADLK